MSRNAEQACIDAANERDDQRETARREWLEAAKARRLKEARDRRIADAAPELVEALQAAQNVLFLLSDEVKALGCKAENVPEKVRAALAKAGVV